MSKHTKGPWHLFSHRGSKTVAILDTKKKHQPEVVKWGGFDEEPFSLQEANAKRIVAAVNFCEGFSSSELAKMGSLKEALEAEHDRGFKSGAIHGKLHPEAVSLTPPKDKT